MNPPCDTARLTWITIRTVPANVKCPNGFPPQAGGVTLFPDRFEPRTVDNLEHAFSALCTILSLTVFFSAFKIFKGDPTPANILFRRTLCGHVTESRTALCFRNSRLNWPKLLILNSVGILRYCFRFLFHSVQKSTPFKPFNLMRWVWSQQKTRIKNFSIPIFPGSHLANLTFSLTSRTNWLPFP